MYSHCERIFGAKYLRQSEWATAGVWVVFVREYVSFNVPKSACDEIERMGEENESIKGRMLKVAKEGWKL